MTEPLLITKDLVKHFGGIQALQDVSVKFIAGNLQCIIGPNGAGKSTLFNVISGLSKPTAGRIKFEGRDIVGFINTSYINIIFIYSFIGNNNKRPNLSQ